MKQPQVTIDDSGWYAVVGAFYTATATLHLKGANATQVISNAMAKGSSPYLDRPGFWQGAAG